MTRRVLSLLWLVSGAILADASANAQSVDETLQRAIDARRAARPAKDVLNWSRATTVDFLMVHSDGKIHTKTDEFAEITAGPAPVDKPPTEVQVRTYGNTSVYTAQAHLVDGPRRVTEVWVEGAAGHWQVASSLLRTMRTSFVGTRTGIPC